jgi:transglutaminase-like putative cysteine protease
VRLHIQHRTHYRYASPVSFGSHRLMFRPRENHSMLLPEFNVTISPAHRLHWIRDLYENNIGLLDLIEMSSDLVIESECIVQVTERNPFDFIIPSEAEEYPFSYDHEVAAELAPLISVLYRRDEGRVREWLSPYWHPGKRVGTLEFLQSLTKGIYATIKYQRRERKGVQSPAETIECNSGSCRDFAALFIEACRCLGLAARFVSGYMYSPTITGRMSMHGWAEVYLPGAGWIGFDPSWGILADSNYIPAAVTRHAEHAPPISGSYFGTPKEFLGTNVDLYVKRTDEGKEPILVSQTGSKTAAHDAKQSDQNQHQKVS